MERRKCSVPFGPRSVWLGPESRCLVPMSSFCDYAGTKHATPERELVMMRWGMPNPPRHPGITTNIRNTNSPHWRRCVQLTSFAEDSLWRGSIGCTSDEISPDHRGPRQW
jgi:putative SOS response-associated peptidase YedK